MIITWDMYDDYEDQNAKDKETAQRFEDRINEARQKQTAANARYEMLLRREALERVNLAGELAAARKEVAEANEVLRSAQEDGTRVRYFIHEANATDPGRITRLQLARDWRKNYRPTVDAQQLEPIRKRVEKARAEYLNGIADFLDLRRQYELHYGEIHENLRGVRNEEGNTIFISGMGWEARRELKLITDRELYDVQRNGTLPDDVKREKGEEE